MKETVRVVDLENSPGPVSWEEFTQWALYHPIKGYYRQTRPRVGKGEGTDFYTAVNLGPLFGRLLIEAMRGWLGGRESEYTLVEIGAEPGQSAFAGLDLPFAGHRSAPLGNALDWPAKVVLFANEVLDAQPFHRLQFRGGVWREMGLRRDSSGGWSEIPLPEATPAMTRLIDRLPGRMPEQYRLDWPAGSEQLWTDWLHREWEGLLLVCDYGRTWDELLHETPGGTARAYRRHRQCIDLASHPGEQDLTCDLCWDRLEQTARDAGCREVGRERLEAFIVKRAGTGMAAVVSAAAQGQAASDLRGLMSLLHPSHFGLRFECLWAWRGGR